MGRAAQQFLTRAAPLDAARPQPELVGEQFGDAPLADPRQDEQRQAVGAGEQNLAAAGTGFDLAEPAPPGQGGGSRWIPGRAAVTGWRRPASVGDTANGLSITPPVGASGMISPSTVVARPSGEPKSGPAAIIMAPPSST